MFGVVEMYPRSATRPDRRRPDAGRDAGRRVRAGAARGARDRRSAQRPRDGRPLRALGRARARLRASGAPARRRRATADAATGEVVREFASEGEPDGVLLTPCGNRRAHVCAACSEVYRGDAWQLVVVGAARRQGRARDGRRRIRWCSRRSPRRASGRCTRSASAGGKRLPCRPRSRGETCPHGRSLACGKRHARRRSVPGRGDLPGLLRLRAVRRCGTTTRAGCSSARGPTSSASSPARPASRRRRAREQVRVSYVKVAEFQRRGVVHFHTLWRLDARRRRADRAARAVRRAAARRRDHRGAAEVDRPRRSRGRRPVRLGHASTRCARSTSAATWQRRRAWRATSPSTRPSPPRTPAASASGSRRRTSCDDLRCREHARRLITSAWRLGRPRRGRRQADAALGAPVRLRRALLHQEPPLLHHLQGAARGARRVRRGRRATGEAAAKSDHNLIHVSAWSYAGRGYRKAGDALLAASSHARAREHRRLAREAAMDEASRANQEHGEAA